MKDSEENREKLKNKIMLEINTSDCFFVCFPRKYEYMIYGAANKEVMEACDEIKLFSLMGGVFSQEDK